MSQKKSNSLFTNQMTYALNTNNKTIIEKYLNENLISILVQYKGEIIKALNKFCIVEIISDEFAIVTCNYKNYFKVLEKDEVVSSELSYETNFFQDELGEEKIQDNYKEFSCLNNIEETGKGTLLGIIDSGINYKHPEFLNDDGTTRIKYILDFSLKGNGFLNLKSGKVFSENDINNALKSGVDLDHIDTIGHGTSVASIAGGNTGVAPKANLCIVKLSSANTKTHDILKGLYFLREISKSLNMPLSINLSIGGNNTSHSGLTLFEKFLNIYGTLKSTTICVANGNEGIAGHHLTLYKSDKARVISNLQKYNLYVFIPKNNKVKFKLSFDNGVQSPVFSKEEGVTSFSEKDLKYYVSYGTDLNDIFDTFNILVEYEKPKNSIMVIDLDILCGNGEIHMYLPILEKVGEDTYFSNSNMQNTLTFPSTATNVISVAGVNSSNSSIAPFSGQGYTVLNKVKPNVTAPAVNIISADSIFGYTFKTGTSFAAPIVTGMCSLLFEKRPYLKGVDVKSLVQNNTTKLESIDYPNEKLGYGFACYNKIKNATLEDKLYVNFLVDKKIDTITINPVDVDFKIIDEVFGYYILDVNLKNISRFQNIMYTNNIDFEKSKILGLTSTNNLDNIGVTNIHNNQKIYGKDTITALIDTGISAKSPLFLNNGKTRILSIYDVTKNKVYNNEEIQKVVDEDLNDFDEIGHGTEVFTVSSGSDISNFKGCAPQSTIVCAKVSNTTKGNKVSSFISSEKFGISSIDVLKALEFLLKIKDECNLPMVVGIPLTTNESSHLNMGLFEKIINKKGNKNGFCIVTPTGNEGLSKRHSSILTKKDTETFFTFEIQDPLTKLSLYTRKNQQFLITIGSSTFQELTFTLTENSTFVKETFDYNLYINFNNTNEYTELEVGFTGFIRGVWYIRLMPLLADLNCELYLPIKTLSNNSEFLSSSILGTIGVPSTSKNVISVSGYNTITEDFYKNSSFTDDFIYKDIDVSAPAVNILTYNQNGETIVTGTSMSMAYTMGMISLIFEKHPRYNIKDIRKTLRKNAKADVNYEVPNNFIGYGTLYLDKIKKY